MTSEEVDRDRALALKAKARFCLATGIAPSEYDQMTDDEVDAFIEEANRRADRYTT